MVSNYKKMLSSSFFCVPMPSILLSLLKLLDIK